MRTRKYKLFFALFLFGYSIAAYSQNNEMTVTDCQGNIYPVVKIGEQYWMAENLRCTKYDTESERAGKTLEKPEYCDSGNPYYIDVLPASDWKNLDASQIQKCGYLYNWTAAVGLKNKAATLKQKTEFNTRRQGICPNGWHIPTIKEWEMLIGYVSKLSGDTNTAKELMSTTGWNYSKNGTNTYGFNALPVKGCHAARCKSGIGEDACFISATPKNSIDFYYMGLENTYYKAYTLYLIKSSALSVRCVKN